MELSKIQYESVLQKASATKEAEIQSLKANLESIDVAKRLAITEAVNIVEKERGTR